MAIDLLSFSDTAVDYTAIIGLLFTSLISFSLIYNHHHYPDAIKHVHHKRIASAAIICYTIAMIAMCSYRVITEGKFRATLEYIIGWEIFAMFWGCAHCLSYLLFILRLKSTFDATTFTTPQWVYISLYFCVAIFFIAQIIIMVIYGLKYKNAISPETLMALRSGQLIAKFVVDIYLLLGLTYLFVSKLMKLALALFDNQVSDTMSTPTRSEFEAPSRTSSKSMSWSAFKKTVDRKAKKVNEGEDHRMSIMIKMVMKLTKQDERLLLTANKMTVLSITMALGTEFFICVAFLSSEMGDDFMDGFLWYFGVMFFLIIDTMVNTFCIFLSLPYPISRKLYKHCCKCCGRCCLYGAIRNLQKRKFEKASNKLRMNDYHLMEEIEL